MLNKYNNNRNIKASITVEASLVLPIFIYAIIAFLYFLQILLIQETIQSAITQTGEFASQYGFIYEYIQNHEKSDDHKETDNSIDSKYENVSKEFIDVKRLGAAAFYKVKMREYINEDIIDNSCIVGGMSGISLLDSKFLELNDMIEISAIYNIKIPVPIFRLGNIPVIQAIKIRAFTGYKPVGYQAGTNNDNDAEDRIVYITRTGSVYHLKRDCTYIKFNISQTILRVLEKKRNDNGGKYYACESCVGNKHIDSSAIVYITSDGNRYHDTLSCSKLKRSVIEILISKVQGRSACSRCGGQAN